MGMAINTVRRVCGTDDGGFLVDQVQQLCCPLFQAGGPNLGANGRLWEKMRALFHDYALAPCSIYSKPCGMAGRRQPLS